MISDAICFAQSPMMGTTSIWFKKNPTMDTTIVAPATEPKPKASPRKKLNHINRMVESCKRTKRWALRRATSWLSVSMSFDRDFRGSLMIISVGRAGGLGGVR